MNLGILQVLVVKANKMYIGLIYHVIQKKFQIALKHLGKKLLYLEELAA